MRQPRGGWEYGLHPSTINNFRQNTPELIIRDARWLLDLDEKQCELLRQILLARGVNKWLYCRRLIIELKHELRAACRAIQKESGNKRLKRFLTETTGKLRAICHHPRWVEWPDIAHAGKASKRVVIRGPNA